MTVLDEGRSRSPRLDSDRSTRLRAGRSGELLRALVRRDVTLRYRRSLLGLAWSQIAPLSMIVVFSVVFTGVVSLGIPDYPAFVFTGLLAWLWFQSGLVAATSSVVDNRDLIRQPGFPATVLPAVAIASQLVTFALSLPALLIVVGLWTGRIPPTVVALPLIAGVQFVVTLGPAYVLAAFNVTFRDVGHLIGILTMLLFYATPVFYDASGAPDRFRLLYELNPMARLIAAYRDAVLYGRWPDLLPLFVLAAVGASIAFVARRVFLARSRTFVQEL